MSEWKTIDEWPKMPDKQAIIWDGYNIRMATYDAESGTWWVLVEYTVDPTHWMELPEPPNE